MCDGCVSVEYGLERVARNGGCGGESDLPAGEVPPDDRNGRLGKLAGYPVDDGGVDMPSFQRAQSGSGRC